MDLTLDALCELIVDCEHKTAPLSDQGYPSIRTPNIGRGRLILDGVNLVDEQTYRAWTRRAAPKAGDLIVAREAPVGNVAVVPENLKVCLGQRTVLVRPDPVKIEPRFLLYFLLGDYAQNTWASMTAGATVAHLNMKDIRGLKVPSLPDRATQCRIASILSAYDDLIENNTRRIAILEEMARRIYEEWFVHFRFPGHEDVPMVGSGLGRIPAGWEWRTLGDLARDRREATNPADVEPDTPYVGLEHIPRRSIALAEWGSVSDVQSTKLRFSVGEILFGKIRPYFHKVAVPPISGVTSSDAIVIQAIDSEYFPVVLAIVSSDAFVAHATQTSNGTKMPRANWPVLLRYPVPVPPRQLRERFDGLMLGVVGACRNFVMRNRNLRTQRDLLLPKLISGEIDVSQVPEPESAAA